MAKYNVPFVNINTFLYEIAGVEIPEAGQFQLFDVYSENGRPSGDVALYARLNTMGFSMSTALKATLPPEADPLNLFGQLAYHSRNHKFQGFGASYISEIPVTASWLNVLNTKRNGPYGHTTWRQIRTHENPCTRNQKKRNIFTLETSDETIESFIERPVSLQQKDFAMFTTVPNSLNAPTIKYKIDLNNRYSYFDNNKINNLHSPYVFGQKTSTIVDDPTTDTNIIKNFIIDTNLLLDERYLTGFTYSDVFYPPVSSLRFIKRTRNSFFFPWKDDFSLRGNPVNDERVHRTEYKLGEHFGHSAEDGDFLSVSARTSLWPLDIHQDYSSVTSSLFLPDGSPRSASVVTNAGVLQLNTGYMHNGVLTAGADTSLQRQQVHPLYSYKHLLTELTSAVAPCGMTIEGVNNGSLYDNLKRRELVTGEAFWDAPTQYGKGPFDDDYSVFVDDIKRKYKDHSIIPEFRSSMFFQELQDKPSVTPLNFLEMVGGQSNQLDSSSPLYKAKNKFGKTNPTLMAQTSSEGSSFFNVYSHSEFLKNFDVAIKFADEKNCSAAKIKITCKGVKKFIPYEGFYPAQRTVEIAAKFRDGVMPQTTTSGAVAGPLSSGDETSSLYFNNIMQPMFGPGILYNSIKSGIAVDYPIHTSSLTIQNGGVNIFENNYYIQKSFDERIPFEALIEPNIHLTAKDFHCSNPHPSGNISGSCRYSGQGDINDYTLAMHNFLAETPNFFLQDQNFSFISSEKSNTLNLNLESGSVYGFNIRLFKSQNFASDQENHGGTLFPCLLMTGSGVQETFTMYSNPQSFGPPSRITGSPGTLSSHTSSYSNLGYNWAFTPPYYDGISETTFLYNCNQTSTYKLQDIFNEGVFLENRLLGFEGNINAGVNMDNEFRVNSAGSIPLSNQAPLGRIAGQYNGSFTEKDFITVGYGVNKQDCMLPLASININLGVVKEVDLLDDDTSDVVKVAVDISSQQETQIIIQPKWETPMFNFQGYSTKTSVTLPQAGSQSAPRGMWHQYGQIEDHPKKGVFMQVANLNQNWIAKGWMDSVGANMVDLADMIGLSKTPVKLGRTAQAKVVREAVVAVPYYASSYNPETTTVESRRKFIPIPRKEIDAALDGKSGQVDTSIQSMVEKMQSYVMPPMFNFLEDQNISPKSMYIFEFTHTFDQEDLGAMWQNLAPKEIADREQEVSVEHTLNTSQLLRSIGKAPSYQGVTGNMKKTTRDVDIADTLRNNIKWMVFKVKQKAQQNYYDKVVGETQKLVKTSPYSHNWPYDYFSLVELAKIETDISFQNPAPPAPIEEVVNPTLGSLYGSLSPAAVAIPPTNVSALQTQGATVFPNNPLPTTGSGGL
jgi:hypothetical protein